MGANSQCASEAMMAGRLSKPHCNARELAAWAGSLRQHAVPHARNASAAHTCRTAVQRGVVVVAASTVKSLPWGTDPPCHSSTKQTSTSCSPDPLGRRVGQLPQHTTHQLPPRSLHAPAAVLTHISHTCFERVPNIFLQCVLGPLLPTYCVLAAGPAAVMERQL